MSIVSPAISPKADNKIPCLCLANRPEEFFFTKLDSSLKKNTAFIKRLKIITEAQRDSLIKDMSNLNLTKYISEAAAALVEAKIKMGDVNTAVQVCSLLHQRYSDFAPSLLDHWQKVLALKRDEKITNPSKLRVDLRFYAELISVGVFTLREGLPFLGNLLTVLTTGDKEDHSNLSIILSFCRHCGEDYVGLVPRKTRVLAQQHDLLDSIPKSELLQPDRQRGLRSLLKEYYKSLCKHVVKDHKSLQAMERQNKRILQTKGELSVERKEKWEMVQGTFQKLFQGTQQLADILDEELPDLPPDDCSSMELETATMLDVHNRFKDDVDGYSSLWEDEDTRMFYENLPDLKSSIPGIIFKDNIQPAPPPEQPADALAQMEESEIELEGDLLEEEEGSKESLLAAEPECEPEEVASTGRVLVDSFLSGLLNCVNREMVDQAANNFCTNHNTKNNRRKLIKTLFSVPRTRLDLLPFYARFVAILHPVMMDISNELVSLLKHDFKFHVKKKDQINIESKVKTVRYIGELVKFQVFSRNDALFFLKTLLLDFSHHHIEMACNLLETCGRFLLRSPETHQRTKIYLDQMMRKKMVRALDSRYITMIENAFYYCNPPDAPAATKVERPPLHEYIRKLLYKDLTKNNTEKILKQMRKLDWEDPEVSSYATKCLTAIWNVKYYNIRCVANLLSGLVAYQETVGPQVVDAVLEDIRLGLELNHPKFNQRRVSIIRYLGELYNYRMVESSVIFKTLYSLISFGVSYIGMSSDLDPPDNHFRLRLVCILLETCGQYFNSGSSKKKLDCFLVFFQYYYQIKKSQYQGVEGQSKIFPVTMEFMVQDTILALRPKLKPFQNQADASAAIQGYIDEFKPWQASGMGYGSDDSGPLGPIQEVEEEEDDEARSHMAEEEEDEDEEEEEEEGHYAPASTQSDEDMPAGSMGDVPPTPRLVSCTEDEDFMSAFDKMLSESIIHRSQVAIKPQADITIPLNIKAGRTSRKSVSSPPPYLDLEKAPSPDQTVNFVLMTRRGNKQQFKSLQVPVSSELAQNLRDQEEAERMEKQQVKRLTLDINERQEEEDYQEMLAQQRPMVMNLNRDRRHKYLHPKGAPDADLIFGNNVRAPADSRSLNQTKEALS
ncbi:UPF2 [Cordylochernes scorpioides]|uniref:UPF2 n=1 Tax=Cordylochernes scorpioides TaxID=51811 RepID=A0ABY6K7K5_9ARAC|nr:UPF2 [Cordylochernes scorpioides]